jgi:hypothetical protein
VPVLRSFSYVKQSWDFFHFLEMVPTLHLTGVLVSKARSEMSLHNCSSFSPWTVWMTDTFGDYVKDEGPRGKEIPRERVHSTDLTHTRVRFFCILECRGRHVSFPLHNRASFSPWTAWMSEPFANYVKDDEAKGKKCKARVPCT